MNINFIISYANKKTKLVNTNYIKVSYFSNTTNTMYSSYCLVYSLLLLLFYLLLRINL
uniref:Uncharacterized protein n=1 Tax=viral metagenome TaxID=1070528 RepID=A0A6C0EVC5_9ZZZZ